jgi:hypothetical protein
MLLKTIHQGYLKECPNLMATGTYLDYAQVAMRMIHPITGKTSSSYKRLMKGLVIAEMWQTAFGKDFGGMAQDDQR